MSRTTCFAIVSAFLVMIPGVTLADPVIVVTPSSHDFGNVVVGESSTCVVTVTNEGGHPLYIYSFGWLEGNPTSPSIPGFTVESNPPMGGDWGGPYIIPVGGTWTFLVHFTPLEEGEFAGTIFLGSNDPFAPGVYLPVEGTGVASEPSPSEQIQEILDFIDDSLSTGTLWGDGPGSSAAGRLKALINMIEAASDLIDEGEYEQAEEQLWVVYDRCDGLPRPPDFVGGPAALDLNNLILDLILSLYE